MYKKVRSLRDTLFGQCWMGQHIETGRIVLIKQYDIPCVLAKTSLQGVPVSEDPKLELELHSEVTSLLVCIIHLVWQISKLRPHQQQHHPFIVEMLDITQDENNIYSVLEFCEQGCLPCS